MKRIVMSLDSAFKTGTHADYSAAQIWGEAQLGYYLLHSWRGRVEYPELKRVVISLNDQWKPEVVLIEDCASGISLIQELQSTTSLPLKPIRPDKDKVSRAESTTPMWESGRVFLPASAPWLEDFMDELCAFPSGAHDDQVDCMTQALNYLRDDSSGVYGVLDYIKAVASGAIDAITGLLRPTPREEAPLTADSSAPVVDKFLAAHPPHVVFNVPTPACPACGSTCTARCSGQNRCNSCGHQWFAPGALIVERPITRADLISGRWHARTFRIH